MQNRGPSLGTLRMTPLLSEDPKEAAAVEVWAEVEAQRFEPPASKLTWELGIKPMLGMPTDDAVVAEQEAELAKVLDVYEARLTHSKYLARTTFSLADLHHLPTFKYLLATPVKAVFDANPPCYCVGCGYHCQAILAEGSRLGQITSLFQRCVGKI